MSEYAGRIYALRKLDELKAEMIFSKVDSAAHDIQNFLDKGQDLQDLELLQQAVEQLTTLRGFLMEFK